MKCRAEEKLLRAEFVPTLIGEEVWLLLDIQYCEKKRERERGEREENKQIRVRSCKLKGVIF